VFSSTVTLHRCSGSNEGHFNVKQVFNIPTKCASLLLVRVSITSLLHVSVCYIHHLQGEPLVSYTTSSVVYCVMCVTLVVL